MKHFMTAMGKIIIPKRTKIVLEVKNSEDVLLADFNIKPSVFS